MAKTIRVSDDAGANYYNLPGSEGSIERASESADDTIFGNTFQSNQPTLLATTVTANAMFRGFAGYNVDLKKQGTATTMTAEATTSLGSNVYQITDTTKRILDRSAAVVVDDNATPVAAADIEYIDYLFGKVKFVTAYTPTGAITFDADYFPTVVLGKAQSFDLSQTADFIDTTDFATAQANGGYRTGNPGLRTIQLDISGVHDPTSDFPAEIAARNEFVIDIDLKGDGTELARGFFKLQTQGQEGAVGALEVETLSFVLNVPQIENPPLQFPFGWQHDGASLMSTALQKCIDAFQNETKLRVQYLPSGAPGQSPLDGAQTEAVVTDLSMSSGLTDVVTFEVTFQGDGAVTTV